MGVEVMGCAWPSCKYVNTATARYGLVSRNRKEVKQAWESSFTPTQCTGGANVSSYPAVQLLRTYCTGCVLHHGGGLDGDRVLVTKGAPR